MNLSRREHSIGVITAFVVAVLAADHFLLTPYLDRRDRLEKDRQAALAEWSQARELLARQSELVPQWEEALKTGVKIDPGAAESATLNAIRDWAAESGLTLASVKPEGGERRGRMQELTFQAVGEGQMRNVSLFLWRIENAALPVKATDLQLAARKEGADDLTLQVRIAALCMAETEVAPAKKKPGRPAGEES